MNERVKVAVISTKGASTLVEYVQEGLLTRVYIPTSEVGDGHVLAEVLAKGILHGYPWEELDLHFDTKKLADELHQVGVWTQQDALRNPKKVSAALSATLAVNLSTILTIASNKENDHG